MLAFSLQKDRKAFIFYEAFSLGLYMCSWRFFKLIFIWNLSILFWAIKTEQKLSKHINIIWQVESQQKYRYHVQIKCQWYLNTGVYMSTHNHLETKLRAIVVQWLYYHYLWFYNWSVSFKIVLLHQPLLYQMSVEQSEDKERSLCHGWNITIVNSFWVATWFADEELVCSVLDSRLLD